MFNLDLMKKKNNINGVMPAPSLILATKLKAPQLKTSILQRPRLIDGMMKARDRRLIVVCADAGYGKTTLLAQFCSKLEPSYVYYNLDHGDNDSARFLIYLVRGFQARFPDFGKNLPDLIAETRETETLIGALINEFTARVKDDFYVLLDDYHCLQRNLEIAKLLDYLLRHIPPNLHLVIASRSRLPINMHYFDAKGELMMLEKEQLRFTEAEIRSLFNTIHKLRVAEDDIKKVVEHSAGWVTAVQLILQKIIARENEPPDETIRASVAAGAPVFDYFAVEILEDHPPAIQDFLLRSSILETIEPTVCDHLLQARNSAKLLEYVTAENVFINKVGSDFRLHPLFRDFLLRRLTTTYPAQAVTDLYRRLADFHLGRHDYQSAADAFLLAADHRRAAAVLTENFQSWRDIGSYESYLDLANRIPAALQDRFPALLVNKMHCLFGVGNIAGIMNNYDTLLRRLRREKDRKPLIDFLLFMSMIMGLVREHRKSLNLARQAERLIPSRDHRRRIVACGRISFAHVELLEYGPARTYAERAVKIAEVLADPRLRTSAMFTLASYHWLSGDIRSAYSIFERFIRESLDQIEPFNRIRVFLNTALLAMENSRESEAQEYLKQAELYMQKYPTRPMLMDLEYWKGHIRIWQDRPADALAAFEKALAISRSLGLRYPEFLSQVALAQVHTVTGVLGRARTAMDRAESLVPANLPPNYRMEVALLKLNLEIDERRFDQARRTRDDLQALVSKSTVDYNLVEYNGLLAYYHLEIGEEADAIKYLGRALAICEKRGYAYIFIYDSRINRRVLELAVLRGISASYLARILPMVKAQWGRDLLKHIQAGGGRYDLECSFFGPFTIKDTRHRVAQPEWRTRNSRSLCAYLILVGEKGRTKDQLIDEFWPRQNLKRAGHSLQVEISALRGILGEILGRPPAKDLIIFKQNEYRISPDLIVKTDIAEFEDRLRQADRPGLDLKKRTELLNRAAELCRTGFCTDLVGEWCTALRDKYREAREKILEEVRER